MQSHARLAGAGRAGLVTNIEECACQVQVVASLPCYSSTNVDEQRGSGVFQRSIQGLQLLNAAGYGQPGTGLMLDLVYNPNGVFLAPPTIQLEVRLPVSVRGLKAYDLYQHMHTIGASASARGESSHAAVLAA